MSDLTIRDLPDGVRDALLQRAQRNGRSLEVEARAMLSDAVAAVERNGPSADGNVHAGEVVNRRGEISAPSPAVVDEAALAERIKRAQSLFAHLRSPNGSIVDEFIAERRAEALAEDADPSPSLRRAP